MKEKLLIKVVDNKSKINASRRIYPRLSQINLPWNTIVGLADPGQMSSSRETYVSARRRAFNSSVASFFCVKS